MSAVTRKGSSQLGQRTFLPSLSAVELELLVAFRTGDCNGIRHGKRLLKIPSRKRKRRSRPSLTLPARTAARLARRLCFRLGRFRTVAYASGSDGSGPSLMLPARTVPDRRLCFRLGRFRTVAYASGSDGRTQTKVFDRDQERTLCFAPTAAAPLAAAALPGRTPGPPGARAR